MQRASEAPGDVWCRGGDHDECVGVVGGIDACVLAAEKMGGVPAFGDCKVGDASVFDTF